MVIEAIGERQRLLQVSLAVLDLDQSRRVGARLLAERRLERLLALGALLQVGLLLLEVFRTRCFPKLMCLQVSHTHRAPKSKQKNELNKYFFEGKSN